MITTQLHLGMLDPARIESLLPACRKAVTQLAQQPHDFLAMPSRAEHTLATAHALLASLPRPHDIVIVVGIGGSSLGTSALYTALRHRISTPAPELWIIDTIDPLTTRLWHERMMQACVKRKNILLCIISKSGTTLETTTNAALFLELLRRYKYHLAEHVVIITDEHSPMHTYAQQEQLPCRFIPRALGGRFSVFSLVSMLPLMALGVPVHEILDGAQEALRSFHASPHDTVPLVCALLTTAYEQGLVIHDTFVSGPHLTAYGMWYRQLCAESLGKIAPNGTRIGIVPTVSCIAEDLHSMVQLYLAGPRRTVTTFLEGTPEPLPPLMVPAHPLTASLLPTKTTVTTVHQALCQGIRKAYEDAQLPYLHLRMDNTPASFGFLMQHHMIIIATLGHLWSINPFDQPQIEQYKKWVRQALT